MAKEALKQFLAAISKDDYIAADKLFPNVVQEAIKNNINKRKASVIEAINAKAVKTATDAVIATKEG